MWEWWGVFACFFFLDIVWAYYTQAIADRKRLHAAFWAGLIPLFSGFATIAYVHDPWLLTAAVLGGMLGTFVAIGDHK